MGLKWVSAAVLAVSLSAGAAGAQTARDLGGPAEVPPSSFTGQQYVDSRGCVYLRAGFGGQTSWVPRVSRDRKALCGYPPSIGGGQVAVSEVAPAPAAAVESAPAIKPAAKPAPRVVANAEAAPPAARKPMKTVASVTAPVRRKAPVAAAPMRQTVTVATPAAPNANGADRVATTASGSRKIGCYRDAPVAERFAIRGGGSVVLCTKGDGDLSEARAPRLMGGAAAVAASGFVEDHAPNAVTRTADTRVVQSTQGKVAVPKGYKAAWQDDRLNTRRGVGTAAGQAAQDEVWTREVPARLVQDMPAKSKVRVVRKVYVSTKAEPAKASSAARSFVQIGTFGEPRNAEGASRRLAGLGLPVARAKTSKAGKPLQIVMAGPFASASQAQAALVAARRAGFSDAFIR